MANYSLIIFDWNDETRNAVASCHTLPSVLSDLCRVAAMNHHGDTVAKQKDIVIDGKSVGSYHGFHYDASIVDISVPSGGLVCVIKHDAIDCDPWGELNECGRMARVLSHFAKAADEEERQWHQHGAVIPLYRNNGPALRVIEVHKTSFRHKGDTTQRWHTDPVTAYSCLVPTT